MIIDINGIYFDVGNVGEADMNMVKGLLAELPKGVIADQAMIRIGWAWVKLRLESDGVRVIEPDYAAWPYQEAAGLAGTLSVLYSQLCFHRQTGLRSGGGHCRQSLSIDSRCLEKSEAGMLLVDKLEGVDNDSGILLGYSECDYDGIDFSYLRKCSLLECGIRVPRAMPFLDLSNGCQVHLAEDGFFRAMLPNGEFLDSKCPKWPR